MRLLKFITLFSLLLPFSLFAREPNLHIYTYANKFNPGLERLAVSSRFHGVDVKTLIIPNLDYKGPALVRKPGNHSLKIHEMLDFLENSRIPDDDVVMFLDAFDTLIVADEQTILERFLSFDASLVMGVEKKCYPLKSLAKKFPRSPTSFAYLNSGCYIGYAGKLKEVLANVTANPSKRKSRSDQAAFSLFYVHNKDQIALDYHGDIVLNLHKVNRSDLTLDHDTKKILINETGRYPCVIHGNGGGKKLYRKLYKELWNDADIFFDKVNPS